jgi:hypothetical protein
MAGVAVAGALMAEHVFSAFYITSQTLHCIKKQF